MWTFLSIVQLAWYNWLVIITGIDVSLYVDWYDVTCRIWTLNTDQQYDEQNPKEPKHNYSKSSVSLDNKQKQMDYNNTIILGQSWMQKI